LSPSVFWARPFFAYLTIRTNRRIARIKATLDLIEATESKAYYQALYEVYRRYRNDMTFRQAILSPETDEDRRAQYQCWDYLNHYELIAIGFKEGILDAKFYRRWMGYIVVRDYLAGAELIALARADKPDGTTGDKESYSELEELCKKWQSK
jgi:hypothetical protein